MNFNLIKVSNLKYFKNHLHIQFFLESNSMYIGLKGSFITCSMNRPDLYYRPESLNCALKAYLVYLKGLSRACIQTINRK